MALEESKRETDRLEEVDGIRFLLDETLAKQLRTIRIDYSYSLFGRGSFSIQGV
ncbi:hypothetical protein BSNK01_22370 [Bacillaceae bacterium]